MEETRKRTTLYLPVSLRRRLKMEKARTDNDMSEIGEDALRRFLDQRDAERNEARRPQHEAG
jgi:hypothetical protein